MVVQRESYVHGNRGAPLIGKTIGALLDEVAAIDGSREAGDRVGIWAPNCAEWTVAQFATAKAGLILVNVNPAYRLSELEHALRAVGCRALISATRFKTSDYIAMIRELVPELGSGNGELKSSRLPELRYVISIGAGSYAGCQAFDRVLDQGKQLGSQRLNSIAAAIQMDDAV